MASALISHHTNTITHTYLTIINYIQITLPPATPSSTHCKMMPGTLTLKGGVSLKKAKKHKKQKKKRRRKDNKDSKESIAGAGSMEGNTASVADGETTSSRLPTNGKRKLDEDVDSAAQKRLKPHDDAAGDRPAEAVLKNDKRTAAEKAIDRIRAEREEALLRQSASLSYREKVDKFNNYLESLSEHHDVPKVGNAGMG